MALFVFSLWSASKAKWSPDFLWQHEQSYAVTIRHYGNVRLWREWPHGVRQTFTTAHLWIRQVNILNEQHTKQKRMLSDFSMLMKLMCSSLLSGLGSSGRYISNASLDVLPVKGPPLSPSEPVLKQPELKLENTWSIKPEQLVLTAPTFSKTHLSLRMWYWKWPQMV